jgi:bifunctional non-homologous end joining protein LigD
MSKSKRSGKIFIDYLRNAHEATAVTPYSTRARPGAPVATPIAWEELASDLRAAFTLANVPGRLKSLADDPWRGFFDVKQSIPQRRGA